MVLCQKHTVSHEVGRITMCTALNKTQTKKACSTSSPTPAHGLGRDVRVEKWRGRKHGRKKMEANERCRKWVWLLPVITCSVCGCVFACLLINVTATCFCISETDLLRQVYVLPHSKLADQTFYLTQSQYTDTGPTSPRADAITSGAWQGSHWSANF